MKPPIIKKPLYGVGINDAETKVQRYEIVDGKWKLIWSCPFYLVWKSMFVRCYSLNYHKVQKTYKGCSVHKSWHRFSVFREWMSLQDWRGKQLDKDLLINNNKEYSPSSCVFVTRNVNNFLSVSKRSTILPIGVSFRKGRYVARCTDPFGINKRHIGQFDTPEEAHDAWKSNKHRYALLLANLQTNSVVADALRRKYV